MAKTVGQHFRQYIDQYGHLHRKAEIIAVANLSSERLANWMNLQMERRMLEQLTQLAEEMKEGQSMMDAIKEILECKRAKYMKERTFERMMWAEYKVGGIDAAQDYLERENQWLEVLDLKKHLQSRLEDLKKYHAKDKSKG